MFKTFNILFHQGRQFIPDPTTAEVPGIFKGRPVITGATADEDTLEALCPTGAIGKSPLCIDLGKCTFCGECAIKFPEKIIFTKDYKIATNDRNSLIIREGDEKNLVVRPEIRKYFRASLKLRQVSAGGDNSCEMELNACGNPNFDMGRYGVEFVASPRHADGIVITGPITKNMAEPLKICYDAMPDPRIIILAGTDAISGGIFSGSPALERNFLANHTVDLFVPGNPVHPLTFINGILSLISHKGLSLTLPRL